MKFQFAAFADESSDSLAGQIDALKRNNYQFLEVRGLDGKNVTKLTLAEAEEVNKKLVDNGLRVWSIGSPIGKVGIDEDFDAHVELYKHTLDLAKVFGAGHIRLFSFFMPKDKAPEEFRNLVMDRLSVLAEIAKTYGVIPCHENEKGIYGENAARCLEIHKAVPGLKAVYDPANFVQCGQETLSAWEMLHPYVEYMHIKDALSDGTIVPPGDGEGNVAAIIEKYAKQGGKVLTLEPHLFEFGTLKTLEQEGDESIVGGMAFATAEEAFDVGVKKLNEIVSRLV